MAPALISVAVASNGISCGSRRSSAARKRRLADTVLADEEQRPPRLPLRRVDDHLDELAAPAGEEGRRFVVQALEDAADVPRNSRSTAPRRHSSKAGRKSSPRYVS